MRRYGICATAIAAAYLVNRFFLIPVSHGALHQLLAWHGADALAGGLMLCILNLLLIYSGRVPLRRVFPATAFLLSCGLFWEWITPLYLARSVPDPRDILAVWLGGITTLLLLRASE